MGQHQELRRYLVSPPFYQNLPKERCFISTLLSQVSSERSLGLKGRRRPKTSVLCQSCNERPLDQILKVGEASVGPLYYLEEAQVLLPNLPDHRPHKSSLEDHHGKSRSNWKDIKMGLRAQILWTQIRAEDSDQRLGAG